ncbi:MAG: 4a-hydroxytetrahydrobiopterin dehydratase [Planctomycetota bacterium]
MAELPDRCVDGAARLSESEIAEHASLLHPDWTFAGQESLSRRLKVQDFKAALRLLNAIGEVAEDQNHHPDLAVSDYRFVTISLTTHDAGGITANDLVLARQADALANRIG